MKVRILFLFINILLLTGCTTSKLYKYTQYPCENKIFKTPTKMVLVAHDDEYMKEPLYYITRNTLKKYKRHLYDQHYTEYIEKKIYPKGSQFKIIGYYWAYDEGPISVNGVHQDFLVKSLNDSSIAWISSLKIDSQECSVYGTDSNWSYSKIFTLHRNTFNEQEVDLSKLTKKKFK